MPSRAVRASLLNDGLISGYEPYHKFDCLERPEDLDALFNVLEAHRDNAGNAPIFTFNAVMGNPDFEAIRNNDFSEFVHEPFERSYERYYGQNAFGSWKAALEASLIHVQFHAREHLNVGLWLRDLRQGRSNTLAAFERGFYGLKTETSSPRQTSYLAAYWPEDSAHLRSICEIVSDGLSMFEKTFGYASRSFIACNFVLPEAVEKLTYQKGVKLIQGQRGQRRPSDDGKRLSIRRAYTGQRNGSGQVYSVRNVMFEPFEDASRDWMSTTLREIREAFFWRRPAIISTHRVNYAGGLDLAHRDRNLRMLDKILSTIRRNWPDAEFLSSDQLAQRIGQAGTQASLFS